MTRRPERPQSGTLQGKRFASSGPLFRHIREGAPTFANIADIIDIDYTSPPKVGRVALYISSPEVLRASLPRQTAGYAGRHNRHFEPAGC